MIVDRRGGKEAETRFRVLSVREDSRLGPIALVEARPITGRTHQIRVHLATAGHSVLGDAFYGLPTSASRGARPSGKARLGLRSVALSYIDPFVHRRVRIRAPEAGFVKHYGFAREHEHDVRNV